jgi:hypothetical protein
MRIDAITDDVQTPCIHARVVSLDDRRPAQSGTGPTYLSVRSIVGMRSDRDHGDNIFFWSCFGY